MTDSDLSFLIEAGLNMLGQNCCEVSAVAHEPLNENGEIRSVCRGAQPVQHPNRSVPIIGDRTSGILDEATEEIKRLILDAKPR